MIDSAALRAWAGVLILGASVAAQTAPFTSALFASGFDAPLLITAPPGDGARVFVVEQKGKVRIVKNGALLAQSFLDLSGLVSAPPTGGNEQGLLGLAFHPLYANNGYLYVNYTDLAGASVVARYRVSPQPDLADPGSGVILLQVAQPFRNHNGGNLAFGPKDGYLYIGLGDGGSANDPNGNAQSGATLLGKMLRIDVDQGSPYAVPATNPFVGNPAFKPEIWALGLRNPWRFSFDRQTGDLYIADVGQNAREEVDFQPHGSPGGENYGWRCMEGSLCTGLSGCACNGPGLTLPIHEYPHAQGCSITGGHVYRGTAISGLQGTYFFADFCSNRIWSFRYSGNALTEFTDRTVELDSGAGFCVRTVTSFGEDALGELYIANREDGLIFKIVPGQGGVGSTLSGPPAIGTQVGIQIASPLDPGRTYVSPFSLRNAPGILFPDLRRLRLEPDLLFTLSLHGGPVFSGTIGVLDPAGAAKVALALPNEPSLVGLGLHTAFLVLDPSAPLGIGRMCCPLSFRIQ